MDQAMEKNQGRLYYLSTILLASGFCGISYEVLYGRLLGDLIGSQFLVNASILLTFLVGIGFGTLYAHRLWRYLFLVEGLIGVYALGFAFSLPALDNLLYSGVLPNFWSYPLLACIFLLALPSFLIGVSLPLFSGYMARLRFGLVFARTYAIYNFGAAIVVLLIEFYLIRLLGVRFATVSIAAINVVIAILLFISFSDIRRDPPKKKAGRQEYPISQKTALILASIGSAIFQLLLIKLGECLFGPFRETFALVLCLILSGIALGSYFVRKLELTFAGVMLANLIGLAWLLSSFEWVAGLYATYNQAAAQYSIGIIAFKMAILVLVAGVPALSFGATIPALMTTQKNVARESGQLLFLSSLANGCGFLLMVLFLHQLFDYYILLLIIGGLSLSSLLLYSKCQGWLARIGVVLGLLLIPQALYLWNENLLYLGHTSYASAKKFNDQKKNMIMPDTFKGPQEVFSIIWKENRPKFFVNGYVSMHLDSPYEPLVGAVSSIFSPRLDRALVLGVGSGNTASVAGLVFDKTDGVEINGTVLKNLHRMKAYNFDIENNPRVSLFQDDAIHYIKAGDSSYSLIINTVTTPLYFSSSKLYTLDFLQAVKKRLSDDGVYVTWVDSRVGDEGIDIMLRTLGEAFEYSSLAYIKSSYFLLICSDKKIKPHNPDVIAENQTLSLSFDRQFEINARQIVYQLLEPDAFGLIAEKGGKLNSVDYPALEFAMTRLKKRGYEGFKKRIRNSMSVEKLAKTLEPNVDFDPVALLLHAERLIRQTLFADWWLHLLLQNDRNIKKKFMKSYIKEQLRRAERDGSAKSFHSLASYLMNQRYYREAINSYQRALNLNQNIENIYLNIGACFEHLKDYDKALKNYQLEQKIDPEDPDLIFRLGRVYVKIGEYEEGLKLLRHSAELIPGLEVFQYLAEAYSNTGQAEAAAEANLRSLEYDPGHQVVKESHDDFSVPEVDAR